MRSGAPDLSSATELSSHARIFSLLAIVSESLGDLRIEERTITAWPQPLRAACAASRARAAHQLAIEAPPIKFPLTIPGIA